MARQDDDRWRRREDSVDLRDAGLGNHLAVAVVLAVADQAAALETISVQIDQDVSNG